MSTTKTDRQRGFTIVELLIVIVVIAILATISIVAFNGIQGRTHDTAVKSDLANLMKKFELYKIDEGLYPRTQSALESMGLHVSKSSYAVAPVTIYNVLPCSPVDGSKAAITAISKSGNRYYVSSETGSVKQFEGGGDWNGSNGYNIPCNDVLPGSRMPEGGCTAIGFCSSWMPWLKN